MVETPVIIGVGEVIDRPADLGLAREPLQLMVDALRAAEADAGVRLIAAADSIDIINEISWPYPDPAAQLCAAIGIRPRRAEYGPVGGQTPVKAIHEAALAIARGETKIAMICGAESESSMRKAQRAQIDLPWSPKQENFHAIRGADFQREIAVRLGISTPTAVYPLYENATRAHWQLSFDEAQAESGLIWSNNAKIAADRAAAWIRRDLSVEEIVTVTPENRMIAWPYVKLMVANPMVNQGGAVILTSLSRARSMGIPEGRIVFIWGGGAADETRDILLRPNYTGSAAMDHSLARATDLLVANDREAFDQVELYSCFPCVPKMARRKLGLAAETALSVTGGLTFFGAPLNDYMTHAAVAMVQALRAKPGTSGLLYGQGEYVTKHHALVLGTHPSKVPLDADYRRLEPAAEAPFIVDNYEGAAKIETFTILYGRDGTPDHGVVIARTPGGDRMMTRVPPLDETSIAFLSSAQGTPIGTRGNISMADDGVGEWRLFHG